MQVRFAVAAAGFVGVVVFFGFAFAGSPEKLAEGTRIAGVDVGGLTAQDARALLEQRAERLADVPVTFTAGQRSWRLRPKQLGVSVDWGAAVEAAQRQGGGFGFVRGYRRLEVRFFSGDLVPPARVYDAALTYELDLIAHDLDRPHREARLVRRGLHVLALPGQTGRVLDRRAAASTIVHALAAFDRTPVALPVRTDPPRITRARLAHKELLAERVISAPVSLALGKTRWRLPRWRLATMLELPQVALRGAAADAYFARLQQIVDRPPRDADFAVSASNVRIVPSQPGIALDVPRTAAAVLAAAERPLDRVARLVVAATPPRRTTADAKAMGITGAVGTFETFYGGDANRVHNVQLVAHLVDGKLIAPGTTFSFNAATGERTAAKGFRTAPVIINGELQTGLGGGVCQVSTTVFNAAYEAGLPITARTNHALYISHYPLGRDATVDYPDIDLKFVNDTGHWLLLRTFVGSSSLVVALYGTPQHRRVVTDTTPLEVVAAPPIEKSADPALDPGETVVDDSGVPAQTTSVRRRVYAPDGKLLSDTTWYSSYRAEPKLVRVGPKKPKAATTTSTEPTTTAPEPPH
jgi:vancomycin resistance protein YoaR